MGPKGVNICNAKASRSGNSRAAPDPTVKSAHRTHTRTACSDAPRIDECTNTVGLRGEVRAFGLARSKGGVPNKEDILMPLPRRKAKAAYRPSQKKLESLESERYMKSKVSLTSLAISLALSERSPHPADTAR